MNATFWRHTAEQVGRAFIGGYLTEIISVRIADHVWTVGRAADYGIATAVVAFGFCVAAAWFRNPPGERTASFIKTVEYRWTR